ncbi:nucleotide exchange factor GrpE [Anaerosacchariphilus polymeriproducens]|uniref:nucleotide exchange factor GrpE n=1 Tax=Anaerosacchariphilus polymeriproducens TaxID=1812858 RepID=UPI0038BC9410
MEEQKRETLEDVINEVVADELKNDQEGDTEETVDLKEDNVQDASQEETIDEEPSEENASEEVVEEKKSIFKKKEKKNKKDEQIEELTDRLKRQMAEFDNFRKRTEKEKAQMYEIGARNVVEKILPIVDNFERGLSAVPEEEKENSFFEGIDMIYKQLITTLEELDVKPIESVGVEFNPNYHNAVMHIEDEEVGENIVVEEFQKGYTYRDNVVRHSMVKVAN